MSKSVLIIETPPCCEDCPCSTIVKAPQINGCWYAHCEACGKFNDKIMTKPEWCPLKPLPDKKNKDFDVYKMGWNACIDCLEGETE